MSGKLTNVETQMWRVATRSIFCALVMCSQSKGVSTYRQESEWSGRRQTTFPYEKLTTRRTCQRRCVQNCSSSGCACTRGAQTAQTSIRLVRCASQISSHCTGLMQLSRLPLNCRWPPHEKTKAERSQEKKYPAVFCVCALRAILSCARRSLSKILYFAEIILPVRSRKLIENVCSFGRWGQLLLRWD